jgi:hypothetical protein
MWGGPRTGWAARQERDGQERHVRQRYAPDRPGPEPFAMDVTTASMKPPCAMLITNSQLM